MENILSEKFTLRELINSLKLSLTEKDRKKLMKIPTATTAIAEIKAKVLLFFIKTAISLQKSLLQVRPFHQGNTEDHPRYGDRHNHHHRD